MANIDDHSGSLQEKGLLMADLTDMEVFARVVAAGSMSGAAREMGLSPAVVSKRLRRLEERLGSRLLQRTTRQIALTEAGEGFYERVVAILASVEEAETFVTRRSSQARGTLKVTAPASFGRMHVAPHLSEFLAANPDLNLVLDCSNEFADIVGSGFDVAIRIAELGDSSLVARKLANHQRVLCAAPSYLERCGTPGSLGELERHVRIGLLDEVWPLEAGGETHSLRPNGRLQTNSSDVVRQAVIDGAGIGLRPVWEVGEELRSGALIEILPDVRITGRIGIYAVYPSRTFLPAKVRVFIDFLSDIYGATPYWESRSGVSDGAAVALDAAVASRSE